MFSYIPIFSFSVLISTQMRQFEQVRAVVPSILNSLKVVHLETDKAIDDVFDRTVEISNSIYEVCSKLVDNVAREKLRAVLDLYVLQCLALLSGINIYDVPSYHSLVLQLSRISLNCGLSYLSLVTTYDVEAVVSTVFGGSTLRL
ncbi:putative glomulin/ALF4 [Medicago truncatula]|uniref:Putative glomulin/ALF4 n=1 Tax=Medicago truncatula TaxID=3880 RepID=A0A396JKV2_MEDTR|nr:putative glomulin/ALF4 [Medicago truncatula]